MENEYKVFQSDITTVEFNENDHLYDLLKITPAEPVPSTTHKKKNETWEFTPNCDKYYVPRKGSKLKVKTVRQIRSLLEKDVYAYLADDLHKQEQFLLRKIRDGFSCDDKTRITASKIVNADNPISRSAWQMLININPGNHIHPKQCVLWNGELIQVNGSKGGTSKLICNYDLKYERNNKNMALKKTSRFKKSLVKTKMGLLRNSLSVKFKPGPLRKKMLLDDSHNKYQMGQIELVKLPSPALEITPLYGTVLEPQISGYINNLRGETGVISQKLAEFASSVLGTTCNQIPKQLDKECCVSFDLNYQCDQKRLLMRRNRTETQCANVENRYQSTDKSANSSRIIFENGDPSKPSVNSINESTMTEIKKTMNDILNTVEISLMPDSMYYSEDEPRVNVGDDCVELNGTSKDKPKRKYLELDKLDVTVIKLPEGSQKDYTKPCSKPFCTMGCICESLDCLFSLKQHCGVLDCMFGCKCKATKYNVVELLEHNNSEIIPGLMNLDNEINSHLAKEEKKFHQTVIVSGEKSIVLKSQKRASKSSKKYAEFYKNMNLKNDDTIIKCLTVDVTKLNCDNIEPFCMVHNLYKCFCRGKFTESSISNISETNPTTIINNENTKLEHEVTATVNCDGSGGNTLKLRLRKTNEKVKRLSATASSDSLNICLESDDDDLNSSCGRTMGYCGRKYSDAYYSETNKKILEMEQNDRLLRKKMMKLMNCPQTQIQDFPQSQDSSESQDCLQVQDCLQSEDNPLLKECLQRKSATLINVSVESLNNDEDSNKSMSKSEDSDYPFSNATVKNSLKDWLEKSYKTFKERRDLGILKNCLDAPKKGKASLQTWDFILSRYSERKNLFFVSNHEPFRTFLAVDGKHPFFANCTNINDIRFADLHVYPLVIRNLVTNSTDSENSFCILRGWDYCWELIGSAVKVIERAAETPPESKETFKPDTLLTKDDSLGHKKNEGEDLKSLVSNNYTSLQDEEIEGDINNLERSKWFVMTVENDFTEIQFYKKGFFVTYDGIQRSICLARVSGKTVRLSSQARADKNSTHQFGIYAIPCISECCVFIGPYEEDEPLGIEVVKTFTDPTKQTKTRGVWITTNKVDNMKVIEQPLSFMPSSSISNDDMVTLDSSVNTTQPLTSQEHEKDKESLNLNENTRKKTAKVVKPIKIRRVDGFYHLSSKNILQKISPNIKSLLLNQTPNHDENQIVLKESLPLNKNPQKTNLKNNLQEPSPNTYTTHLKPVAEIAPQLNYSEQSNMNSPMPYVRPVAEIAPQIKITSVYSVAEKNKPKRTGMFILNPEEINKKSLPEPVTNDDMATDIEKFLETSTICIAPQDEVFVISDGEEEPTITWKNVWIQCTNVANFGCIRGRTNDENLLSFEFPGFKYSDFYMENEAFHKINQVLARKVYIPKNIVLKWQVTKTDDVKREMLTTQCLEEKTYILNKIRQNRVNDKVAKATAIQTIKTYSRKNCAVSGLSDPSTAGPSSLFTAEPSTAASSSTTVQMTTTNKSQLMESLEETSTELDIQNLLLWSEALTRKDEIRSSLNVFNNIEVGMTDTLKNILSMNES